MLLGPVARRSGLRILTYHSIGERDHDMNVRPEQFVEQMEWLATHENVLPLDAALDAEDGIIVTFDDGYRDNLLNAAPVLKKLGLRATVFIVAGRVGSFLDHDAPGAPNELMTWQEIRQWIECGLGVGCHSMTHRRLSQLSEDEQRAEIVDSTRLLRERTSRPTEAFAYPFGSAADYNAISTQLVREAGFTCGLSNRYGVNGRERDRWALRRIWVDATDDLKTFRAKVDGTLDGLALLDSNAGLAARRTLNRVLSVK
jgi:peptidoglycan/xylan/chitin deacetylase (PgdA/CDA1 family)